MPCFKPLKGWASKNVNPSGKRSTVFNRHEALIDLPRETNCGQCIGCRLERSRQWAIRCVHEASLYQENCFITLTYSQENLPKFHNLHIDHIQKFMKKLRAAANYVYPKPKIKPPYRTIRYKQCGEYGEQTKRPHFHALLFNWDFPDRYLWTVSNGQKLYRSNQLEKLWDLGQSTVGDMTFESAAYVARYIMKKVNGPMSERHYEVMDPESGEVIDRKKEFSTQSQSIGKGWLEKFKSDVYPEDFIVLRGKKMRVPKCYDDIIEKTDPEFFMELKAAREVRAEQNAENNTYERLRIREECKELQIEQLKRNYENG